MSEPANNKDWLEGDSEFALREPRCNFRFAAGRVIPKSFIAAIFAMGYYTPGSIDFSKLVLNLKAKLKKWAGVMELFEALVNPSKTEQHSRAHPMPVPAQYIGKPFTECAQFLLETGAIPIGVLRAGGPLPYVLSMMIGSTSTLEDGDAGKVLELMKIPC